MKSLFRMTAVALAALTLSSLLGCSNEQDRARAQNLAQAKAYLALAVKEGFVQARAVCSPMRGKADRGRCVVSIMNDAQRRVSPAQLPRIEGGIESTVDFQDGAAPVILRAIPERVCGTDSGLCLGKFRFYSLVR